MANIYLSLELSQSVNYTNRNNTVTFNLYACKPEGSGIYSYNYNNPSGWIWIGNDKITFTKNYDFRSANKILLKTYSKTFYYHEAENYTVSVSATFNGGTTYCPTITVPEHDENLTKIPAIANIQVASTSAYSNGVISYNLTNTNALYKYTIDIIYKTETGTTTLGTLIDNQSKTNGSFTAQINETLTNALNKFMTRKNSEQYRLIIYTRYNGSYINASESNDFTIYVPTGNPSITTNTWTDTSGYYNAFNKLFAQKSFLKIQYTSKCTYSAIINDIEIYSESTCTVAENKIENIYWDTEEIWIKDVYSSTTTFTAYAKITDSRNRTGIVKLISVPIENNSTEYITAEIYRSNSSGVKDDNGEYCKFKIIEANVFNTTGKITIKLQRKTGDNWETTNAYTNTPAYFAGKEYLVGGFLTTSTYDVRIFADGYTGEIKYQTTVGSAKAVIDYEGTGNGVTFGQIAEAKGFNNYYETNFYAPTTITNVDAPMIIDQWLQSSTSEPEQIICGITSDKKAFDFEIGLISQDADLRMNAYVDVQVSNTTAQFKNLRSTPNGNYKGTLKMHFKENEYYITLTHTANMPTDIKKIQVYIKPKNSKLEISNRGRMGYNEGYPEPYTESYYSDCTVLISCFMKPSKDIDVYSISEIFTGETWIDGKAIYRRTFKGDGGNTANKAVTVATGLDIDMIMDYKGFAKYGADAYQRAIGSLARGNANDGIDCYYRASDSALIVASGSSTKLNSFHVTVYYTKKSE